MIYGGIDFSITCPAITFYRQGRYYMCAWTQEKKMSRPKTTIGKFTIEVRHIHRKSFPTSYDFYFSLVSDMIDWMKHNSNGELICVGIEQYAFSASGKITLLAECVGILKYMYHKTLPGFPFIEEIAIGTGKMVGNKELSGGASKYTNIEYFLKNECNFLEPMKLDIRDEMPIADLVDSFNIMKVLKLYDDYKADPVSVDKKLQKTFKAMKEKKDGD